MLRRLLLAFILMAIFVPLALPYITAMGTPAAWGVWQEGSRIADLFFNSVALAGLTCVVAVPIGVALAMCSLVSRQRSTALIFALGLAIPLPILTVSGTILGSNAL